MIYHISNEISQKSENRISGIIRQFILNVLYGIFLTYVVRILCSNVITLLNNQTCVFALRLCLQSCSCGFDLFSHILKYPLNVMHADFRLSVLSYLYQLHNNSAFRFLVIYKIKLHFQA